MQTNGPVRIGVVIPAYNAEAWVARAAGSVLAQATPPVAVVVSDDGSTDGTVETARALGDRVTVLTGPNRGACHARNLGAEVAVAQGATHLLFLDADDEIEGDYLGAAAEAAAESGADMLFGPVERRRDGATVDVVEAAGDDPETAFEGWLAGTHLNPAGLFFRADFLERIGGWDETVLINQDGELALRALLARPRLARVPRGRGIYHLGHPSLSSLHSEAKLANYVGTLERLLTDADAAGFGARTRPMEDTLYVVARMAFRAGWPGPGRRAIEVLKARGVRRHPGNLPHRVVAGIVGLERKVRLWGS